MSLPEITQSAFAQGSSVAPVISQAPTGMQAPTADAISGWDLPQTSISEPIVTTVPSELSPQGEAGASADRVPVGSGESNRLLDNGLPEPLHGVGVESIQSELGLEMVAQGDIATPTATAGVHVDPMIPAEQARLSAGNRDATSSTGNLPRASGPADPWIEKALSLRRLGQIPEAIASYQKALELSPHHPIAANNLADLYVEQGNNLDEAIALVTDVLTSDVPDRGPFYSTLGWAYAKKGDLESAEKFLNEALQARATAGRLYRRGRVYAAMGLAARARADYDRALVYSEDAATAALIRQAMAEIDQQLPGQGTSRAIR